MAATMLWQNLCYMAASMQWQIMAALKVAAMLQSSNSYAKTATDMLGQPQLCIAIHFTFLLHLETHRIL